MSRGPGAVMTRIAEVFEEQPAAHLTVDELVSEVYPDQIPDVSKRQSVRRALRRLAPRLGLRCCRVGKHGRPGWRHVWGC